MKKMNRSQSSFRQCKTLINEDESQNWMNKYASRHHPPLKQLANPNIISMNDLNKENNSLYQSISQRNFATKSTQEISQFDPGQSISRRLQQKCRQQEKQLKKLYQQREEYVKMGMSTSNAKGFNYSQKYYQSEIESLKSIIKQKERELQFYKQEYSSKSEDMDSMSSELSCKMQRDNKEKNMYIRQINAKVIENNNLLQRLKIHKAQIQTLRLCINEKDKTLQEYQEKLGQVDMKKKKVQHYEYQMKQYNEMLRQIEARTQKLKQQADAKDMIINDKSKSIVQLEQTIGSYEDKLRAIEQSLIKISEDKKVMMDRNQELSRECCDWKDSYDDLLRKSQSIQEYQIKLKTYLGMLEDLNRKNMELMSVNEKYRISCVTLEKNIGKYQEMDKEMGNLKRQLKDRDEKLMDYQVKEKAFKHLEESYTKIKREKEDLMLRYQQKSKQSKALGMQVEQYRNRVSILQQEMREIEQNNNRVRERGEKMQILMKENNRLTGSLHEKVNQIEKLQIKLNNMQIKLNEKGNEMLKMKGIIEQNQQEIHETKLQVQDLRERYEIETNNRILNEDKVLRCTQEIFALKCSITKLQTENNQINGKIIEISQNHQMQMQGLKEMLTKLNESKVQCQNLLVESKQKIEMMRLEIDGCRTELFDATVKEKQHRDEIVKLEDHIIELTQKFYNLRQEKSQIIQKCKQLREIHDFVMKFKDAALQLN